MLLGPVRGASLMRCLDGTQCRFTLAAERAIFQAELLYGTGNVEWAFKDKALAMYNVNKVMPECIPVNIALNHDRDLNGTVTKFNVDTMWLPL